MTLEIISVSKHYESKQTGRVVRAVSDVSVTVRPGETLGIIGESGCGKSTLARLIAGLEQPSAGSVTFEGVDVATFARPGKRDLRRRVQMVFQDPYSSLNPRLTAGAAIAEVIRFHHTRGADGDVPGRVRELLDLVGLNPVLADAYPAQMSGGQRQRVCIARALAAEPSLLVLDEPVSALDVSVRAGIMNLLVDLKQQLGLTYVFISHDLGMVAHISDIVLVMYLGRVAEFGPMEQVMENPVHPYTKALLKAAPRPSDIEHREPIRPVLTGEVPSPTNPPAGCPFHPRCEQAREICTQAVPTLVDLGAGHSARCVLALTPRA